MHAFCLSLLMHRQPPILQLSCLHSAAWYFGANVWFMVIQSQHHLLCCTALQVPMSAGRWSAFWMMPQPQPGRFPGCQPWVPGQGECGAYGGWPRSGEIDILEHVNQDLKVLGTLHWGTQSGQQSSEGGSKDLTAEQLQGFNVYQVKWSCDAFEWYVNGQRMHYVGRSWVQPRWPFDEPFFLILNTAVGGALTGYADADPATAEMLVDYVRVYAS
jgi:beta-glucanase (GH16 family)